MLSTMQDRPLTVQCLFQHGTALHSGSGIAAFDGDRVRHTAYADLAARVHKLAAALKRLGVWEGGRVGGFFWNTPPHPAASFAIPWMGAVLHTLNARLFPEQLSYIVNHAEDRIVIVDASLVGVLAKAAEQFRTVERYLVIGRSEEKLPGECLDYEEVLGKEEARYEWPEIDERSAAGMCYTSGTTGNPKGVAYSHRSSTLHSMGACLGNAFALSEQDRVLPVVPMFHANAWGLPYAGLLSGAAL